MLSTTADTSEATESAIGAETGTAIGGARGGPTVTAIILLPAICTVSIPGAMGTTRVRGTGARGEVRMEVGVGHTRVREVGVAAGVATGDTLLQVLMVSA